MEPLTSIKIITFTSSIVGKGGGGGGGGPAKDEPEIAKVAAAKSTVPIFFIAILL